MLCSDELHALSDIAGGLTENKCVGRYGHFYDGYWDEPHRLEREAFAHFFESSINNNTEYIKQMFPNAYHEFERMVDDIL